MAAKLAPYRASLTFNPLLNRLTYIYLNLNLVRTEGFELNGDVTVTRRIRLAGAAWNDEVNALAQDRWHASHRGGLRHGHAPIHPGRRRSPRTARRLRNRRSPALRFLSQLRSHLHRISARRAPKELAIYANMSHGQGAHAHHAASADGTKPLQPPVPIHMTPALDAHPLVAEIVLTRALAISKDPAHEAVVPVAHSPISDEENAQWLREMGLVASAMRPKSSFHRIDYLTVRDDAPEPIRGAAAAELRSVVERNTAQGDRVLVVPLPFLTAELKPASANASTDWLTP
jgi:hypothetical protein